MKAPMLKAYLEYLDSEGEHLYEGKPVDPQKMKDALTPIAGILKKKAEKLTSAEVNQLVQVLNFVRKNVALLDSDKANQKKFVAAIDEVIKGAPALAQGADARAQQQAQQKQTQIANTLDYSAKLPGGPAFNAQWHQMALDAANADKVKGGILLKAIQANGEDFYNWPWKALDDIAEMLGKTIKKPKTVTDDSMTPSGQPATPQVQQVATQLDAQPTSTPQAEAAPDPAVVEQAINGMKRSTLKDIASKNPAVAKAFADYQASLGNNT